MKYKNPHQPTARFIDNVEGETEEEAKRRTVDLIYELDRDGALTGIKNITRGKIWEMLDAYEKT